MVGIIREKEEESKAEVVQSKGHQKRLASRTKGRWEHNFKIKFRKQD